MGDAGPILWSPTAEDVESANETRFRLWLGKQRGLWFEDYPALWRWSVDRPEDFWESIWDYFDLRSPTPYRSVLEERRMPGARWFAGARLNYAEEMLDRASDSHPAIISVEEGEKPRDVSLATLRREVASLAAHLRAAGVKSGDRVVAYLPNRPEAVVGLLATASIGAVWAICGPDFGARGARERFGQLEPKVLIGAPRYRFGGRDYERVGELEELVAGLPTVNLKIATGGGGVPDGFVDWNSLVADVATLEFESVEFDHPLWVLYSSGTTGAPKGIVHGHGGIVLEHLKSIVLGADTKPGDRFFYYSSPSWMVWNRSAGCLLAGASLVLYDGSATWPDTGAAWRVAADVGATLFGLGAAYLDRCEAAKLDLSHVDLRHLRTIVSTGSVLPARAALWLTSEVPPRVRLNSASGGTDVCSALVSGSPTQKVILDRIGGCALGVDVEVWDELGRGVVEETGEMVITKPMPSMPLYLWNDHDGSRYLDAYFAMFPGVWRQGDWIREWKDGSFTIEGRSDATLNRGGVRMGPADIYGVVEALGEIKDSLVVGLELAGGGYYMPLFVVCDHDVELDDRLRDKIVQAIRADLSPRHVPDEIVEAPVIPRTPTGKKQEVMVKRVLGGAEPPPGVDHLSWFENFSREHTH